LIALLDGPNHLDNRVTIKVVEGEEGLVLNAEHLPDRPDPEQRPLWAPLWAVMYSYLMMMGSFVVLVKPMVSEWLVELNSAVFC